MPEAIALWAAEKLAEITLEKIVTSALLNIAASVVLGGISRAFTDSPAQSSGSAAISSSGRLVTVRQPISPWQVVVGQARVGGVITYIEVVSRSGGTDNVLNLVITFAGHVCQEIGDIYFDDELVPLDGAGAATGRLAGYVGVTKSLGDEAGQPFTPLVDTWSDGLWTDAHRQTGRTKIWVRLVSNPDLLPQGLPNITAVIKGALIEDRRGSPTLGWSQNAALWVSHYLENTAYGLAADYASEIDPADLVTAANACDESVLFGSSNTWAAETNSLVGAFKGICWSPEKALFVAIADGATSCMTSPDGVVWTTRAMPAGASNWLAVCWSPALSLFCAVSYGGTNEVATSPDGITWTARTPSAVRQWSSVCWSPERALFCAVSSDGAGNALVMTSPNGAGWTSRIPPATGLSNQWGSVCWSPALGLFCAVASGGVGARVMTSPDGVTWTAHAPAETNSWQSVCWSPELALFCAVAFDGTHRVMTSADGTTWTAHTAAEANSWQSVAWSPEQSQFCAVAADGTNRTMLSADGTTWTAQAAAEANVWQAVAWAPALAAFAAVSSGGTHRVMILISQNEVRYAVNGSFLTSEQPKDVLGRLLAAMAGKAVSAGSLWHIFAGAYEVPTVALTETDLAGATKTQPILSRRDSCNAVKGTFTDPNSSWQPTSFPPYASAAYMAQDNNERVWRTVDLTAFVTSGTQAQRLAKIELMRTRYGMTHVMPCKLTAYKAMTGRTLTVTDTQLGFSAQPFELTNSRFIAADDGTLGVELTMRKTAAAVYDWSMADQGDVVAAPNANTPISVDLTVNTSQQAARAAAYG